MIKLQLVEAGLVECLLDVVTKTVDGESEEDVVQLKTASDLMVLLLLGGEWVHCRICRILNNAQLSSLKRSWSRFHVVF